MNQYFSHPQPPPMLPLRYGRLTLGSRYLLSPLAGYTNLPFRRVVRELGGVGLATTDLVNARGLLAGNSKSLELIETCPEDRPVAVQLFGNDAGALREAAQFLEDRGIDSVDINMGCPVERITKGGSGASMMCDIRSTVALLRQVIEAVRIPVTAKMRLGWDERQLTAPRLARECEQAGAAAVAVHGRTRAQGFKGAVNREGIRRVVEAVERMPIIGNGDVRSVADAAAMLRETGCAGVSIGRGALVNPWIFRQLSQWEATGQFEPAGGFEERLELLKRQFGYLEELRGTERAIVMFRKMGHWYLKAMRVRAALRHRFQLAKNKEELEAALEAVAKEGPVGGTRSGILPDGQVPVPAGPVERW